MEHNSKNNVYVCTYKTVKHEVYTFSVTCFKAIFCCLLMKKQYHT